MFMETFFFYFLKKKVEKSLCYERKLTVVDCFDGNVYFGVIITFITLSKL